LIGSDDSGSEDEDFVAPITEDSYQGQPNPALEVSKDAPMKNLRLDGPLDFGFLFQNPKLKDEEFPALKAREATRTTNILEIAKSINLDGADSTTNTTISTPTTTTPPPERSKHGRSKSREAGSFKSRGKRECRAVSTDPLDPNPKQAKTRDRHGSSDSMTLGVTADEARMRATSAITEASTATSSIPESTEEEWQHRIEMRIKSVETGRNSWEYTQYLEALAKEDRDEGCPMTPNPYDRSISKRTWKTAVNEWRRSLKERALELKERA
jgi:hypothetical protein